MATCHIDSDKFRVTPSYRDRLKFSASQISPEAMDETLNAGSFTGLEPSAEPAKKQGKWGWWALVAPFIL